jgi:hypothetical protein
MSFASLLASHNVDTQSKQSNSDVDEDVIRGQLAGRQLSSLASVLPHVDSTTSALFIGHNGLTRIEESVRVYRKYRKTGDILHVTVNKKSDDRAAILRTRCADWNTLNA